MMIEGTSTGSILGVEEGDYPNNLFGDRLYVTPDDINGLVSPALRFWAARMLPRGLNHYTAEAVRRGSVGGQPVTDAMEVLHALDVLSQSLALDDVTITVSDLKGERTTRPWREIIKPGNGRLQESRVKEMTISQYGTSGHRALLDLFGRQTKAFGINQGQLAQEQLALPGMKPSLKVDCRVGQPLSGQDVRVISSCWEEAVELTESVQSQYPGRVWQELVNSPDAQTLQQELASLLSPFFGAHIEGLNHTKDPFMKYVGMQSLMSWAAGLLHIYHEDRPIFFPEIQPIRSRAEHNGSRWDGRSRSGIRAGSIDGLWVTLINGRQPTPNQLDIIEGMTQKNYGSVGAVVDALRQVFGERIGLEFVDLKFAWGDGDKFDPIRPDDVLDAARQRDVRQVTRYLAFGATDDFFYAQHRNLEPSGILDAKWLEGGSIYYIFPTRVPIVHHVSADHRSLGIYISRDIAARFDSIRANAATRTISNWAVGLLPPKSRLGNGFSGGNEPAVQLRLGLDSTTLRPLHELAQGFLTFVDEGRAIRITGENKKGEPVYELSINRLIELGVLPPDFSLDRRISITCPFPDHRDHDHTPSFSLYPDRHFHCFGCGRTGQLSYDLDQAGFVDGRTSVPHLSERAKRMGKHRSPEDHLVIPEEHHQAMATAQEILQNIIRSKYGVEGRNYLASRAIDLDLAISLGAGFGTGKLISDLMESGYTLDQLSDFGFIRFSTQVKSGLVPLLKSRGMSLEEMKRPTGIKDRETQQDILGLPYSALDRRVTFILGFPVGFNPTTQELEMKWTNIYGRATWEGAGKFSRHRKLSVANTRVPQGGFNMQALGLDYPIIRITEGAFDTLAYITMGLPATMALIGTANDRITRSLFEAGKKVILTALDNDESGRNKAEKLRERLRGLGFQGTLADFTAELHNLAPGTTIYKDPNDWLINSGGIIDLRSLVANSENPEVETLFYELSH